MERTLSKPQPEFCVAVQGESNRHQATGEGLPLVAQPSSRIESYSLCIIGS